MLSATYDMCRSLTAEKVTGSRPGHGQSQRLQKRSTKVKVRRTEELGDQTRSGDEHIQFKGGELVSTYTGVEFLMQRTTLEQLKVVQDQFAIELNSSWPTKVLNSGVVENCSHHLTRQDKSVPLPIESRFKPQLCIGLPPRRTIQLIVIMTNVA